MIVTRQPQRLPNGMVAERITLTGDGIRVMVGSLGATLMRIDVPDRDGAMANVILGSDQLADYPAAGAEANEAYLGATCGRVANRIRDARVEIDGVAHRLLPNDGRHQLHGGPDGFHRRLWAVEALADGVRLNLVSPDGDQGWPGTLAVSASFRLVGARGLEISYRARTDRPTHANIVSHPYFNLAGDGRGTIDDHVLEIDADFFLENDADALPTGMLTPVERNAFDFRVPVRIGDNAQSGHAQLRLGRGYNHCYRIRPNPSAGPSHAATLAHPGSGRRLDLYTDQPGLHLYTGDWLDENLSGSDHAILGARSGLCLEAEAYPDAANGPNSGMTLINPEDVYRSTTTLVFSAWEQEAGIIELSIERV